jgi:hypothetical protein
MAVPLVRCSALDLSVFDGAKIEKWRKMVRDVEMSSKSQKRVCGARTTKGKPCQNPVSTQGQCCSVHGVAAAGKKKKQQHLMKPIVEASLREILLKLEAAHKIDVM